MTRAEPDAVQTILEFIGKKGTPAETFMDNPSSDKLMREGFDSVDKNRRNRIQQTGDSDRRLD